MRTLENFLAGSLVLIGIYLVLRHGDAGRIVRDIAEAASQVFRTLQAR